jgi:trimethylamine--corrinoid protein Co-methyltransferase
MKTDVPAIGASARFKASSAVAWQVRLLDQFRRSGAGSDSNIDNLRAANENQPAYWDA